MFRVGERIFSDDSSDSDAESYIAKICIAERVEIDYKSENCKPAKYTNRSDFLVNLPPFSMASSRTGDKAWKESHAQRIPPSSFRAGAGVSASSRYPASAQPILLQKLKLLKAGEIFHLARIKKYESLLGSERSLLSQRRRLNLQQEAILINRAVMLQRANLPLSVSIVCREIEQLREDNLMQETNREAFFGFINSQIVFHKARLEMHELAFALEQTREPKKKELVFSTTQKLLAFEAKFHEDQANMYRSALSFEKLPSSQSKRILKKRALQILLNTAIRDKPASISEQQLWASKMDFHAYQAEEYKSLLTVNANSPLNQQSEREKGKLQEQVLSNCPQKTETIPPSVFGNLLGIRTLFSDHATEERDENLFGSY